MKEFLLDLRIPVIAILFFSIALACKKEDVATPIVTTKAPCKKTNCIDYNSQSAAQSDYNSDADCHGDLDADNDGIACEEPGNLTKAGSGGSTGGGSGCPTTANCGCSGKNKSSCGGPCCRWVVGTGCVCY